ncbi:conserved exported protein of unknown function [Tenacibaculum sp. 190524A02b]|uniref:hypothetical protein n=1 Tax=Tenacibaculum vairaonense TaxID=3137860 RepID=UPI0032B2DD09
MFKKGFTLLFLFCLQSSFACLSAEQFKIFPFGVNKETIVTFDVYISRDSYLKTDKDSFKFPNVSWELKTYISVYNSDTTLKSTKEFYSKSIEKETYLEELNRIYLKAYKTVKQQYKAINLFKPEHISFCGFQKKCNILYVENDTILNKNYLVYKDKKQSISLNKFSSYKKSMTFSDNLTFYNLSSIRRFTTKGIQLIIGHLEMGQGTSIANEKKQAIKFDTLINTIYEEPLLHHGYGFDFFIVYSP